MYLSTLAYAYAKHILLLFTCTSMFSNPTILFNIYTHMVTKIPTYILTVAVYIVRSE